MKEHFPKILNRLLVTYLFDTGDVRKSLKNQREDPEIESWQGQIFFFNKIIFFFYLNV